MPSGRVPVARPPGPISETANGPSMEISAGTRLLARSGADTTAEGRAVADSPCATRCFCCPACTSTTPSAVFTAVSPSVIAVSNTVPCATTVASGVRTVNEAPARSDGSTWLQSRPLH